MLEYKENVIKCALVCTRLFLAFNCVNELKTKEKYLFFLIIVIVIMEYQHVGLKSFPRLLKWCIYVWEESMCVFQAIEVCMCFCHESRTGEERVEILPE